jgi:hypothetical protein
MINPDHPAVQTCVLAAATLVAATMESRKAMSDEEIAKETVQLAEKLYNELKKAR